MRYRDFNLTEEELNEVKMSTANLTKLAKNINALAGIEFEMYVPDVNASSDVDIDPEPDYDADERFPTGPGWHRDVIDFFRGGDAGNSTSYIQRKIDDLNENFWGWLEDELQNYIQSDQGQERALEIAADNVSENDYETTEEYEAALREYLDENEDDIIEQIGEEFRDDADSHFERYLDEEGINSMADFANEYGLDWPYWNYPESEGGSVDIDDVALDFSDAVNMPVKASSRYHGATRSPGTWVVEPDGSLDSPDSRGDSGLEFVSPPIPIDQMLEKFDAVMKWANRVGAYTNSTTGLHMNVSIPNYDRSKIDFIKLALFLGDEYVANQFNRLGTFYAKNTTNYIRGRKETNPQAVEELFNQMRSGMNTMASRMVMAPSSDKYMSIHAKDGWIEFRSPGGDYIGEYAANRDKIVNTLLRMVVAMDIAMNPEAEKEEYARKLNRLFKPTKFTGGRGERQRIDEPLTGREEDTIKFFSQYSAGLLPKQTLKSFIRQVQTKREVTKQKPEDETVQIPGQTPSRDQEFTGTWEVVSRPTDEVIYTISGIGNAIQDAERHAARWVEQTGFSDPIYVRPQMRPRESGGSDRPGPAIYSIVNNHDGEVLMPGQQGTWVYIQTIADNIRHRRGIPREDIRIIDMEQNRAYMLSGQPASAGRDFSAVGGEQSSDANYEIVDRSTVPYRSVFRFIANTDQEASRKYSDWLAGNGIDDDTETYGWRRIEGRPTATPIPGSTQDRINQRVAAQTLQLEPLFNVQWVDDYGHPHNVDIRAANANAAMDRIHRNLQQRGLSIRSIEANPAGQTQDQAQGTESLPPGNARWLVLDSNDREVYSFVHRSNQGEANQYAANWLRQQGLLGGQEYMVVPAR